MHFFKHLLVRSQQLLAFYVYGQLVAPHAKELLDYHVDTIGIVYFGLLIRNCLITVSRCFDIEPSINVTSLFTSWFACCRELSPQMLSTTMWMMSSSTVLLCRPSPLPTPPAPPSSMPPPPFKPLLNVPSCLRVIIFL